MKTTCCANSLCRVFRKNSFLFFFHTAAMHLQKQWCVFCCCYCCSLSNTKMQLARAALPHSAALLRWGRGAVPLEVSRCSALYKKHTFTRQEHFGYSVAIGIIISYVCATTHCTWPPIGPTTSKYYQISRKCFTHTENTFFFV